MKTSEMEAMMKLREEEVEDVAAAISVAPNRLSETINYSRLNESIRLKLAEYWNMPVEKLFDQPVRKAERRGSAPALS